MRYRFRVKFYSALWCTRVHSDRDQEEDPRELLPDEAAVIAERAPDLEELDEDEFLSGEEMASKLGIDRKKMENRRELVERTDDDDFVRLDET